MPGKPAFTRKQMDATARARGYRNYDHMIYAMKNRLPPPKMPGSQSRSGVGNFLQKLWNDPEAVLKSAFSWHPAQTVRYARDRMHQAQE